MGLRLARPAGLEFLPELGNRFCLDFDHLDRVCSVDHCKTVDHCDNVNHVDHVDLGDLVSLLNIHIL